MLRDTPRGRLIASAGARRLALVAQKYMCHLVSEHEGEFGLVQCETVDEPSETTIWPPGKRVGFGAASAARRDPPSCAACELALPAGRAQHRAHSTRDHGAMLPAPRLTTLPRDLQLSFEGFIATRGQDLRIHPIDLWRIGKARCKGPARRQQDRQRKQSAPMPPDRPRTHQPHPTPVFSPSRAGRPRADRPIR